MQKIFIEKIFLFLSILLVCAGCNSTVVGQQSTGLDLGSPINKTVTTTATSKILDSIKSSQVANKTTNTQADILLKIQKCKAEKETGLTNYLAAGKAEINAEVGQERSQDLTNIISKGNSDQAAIKQDTLNILNSDASINNQPVASTVQSNATGSSNTGLSQLIAMIGQGAEDTADTDFSSAMAAQTKALELQQQQEQNMISLTNTIYDSKARQETQDLETQAEQIFNQKYTSCLNQ